MIIVNGFNVFPREIDEAMFANPKVKEACAVGIMHPKKGEAPVLYTVLKEGEEMTAEEAEKLKKSISLFKKDLREDDKRFAWEIERIYDKLTEDDVKALVIHHKWAEELRRRFDAELDRTLSQIATEVKALADRYERPLASLEADVAALREKVMSHLAGMGVGVKGAQQ